VASVNGTTIPGTCGTAESAGEFALAAKRTTDTVEVGSTTTAFKDRAVTEPSFADVCVGDQVRAVGPVSAGPLVRALRVTVVPPRPRKTSGTVASVNGTSTAKTCGSPNTAGDFTVSAHGATYSVDVGVSKTTFKEHGVAEPSFDIVCVGDQVTTLGTVSPGNVVSATKVIVTFPSGSSTTKTTAGT
jgi:hypothetical protein